jgi:hypothetical protein
VRARATILAASLLLIALLAALTVYVTVTSGFSVLTLLAVLVLGMLASGVIGALSHPPPED